MTWRTSDKAKPGQVFVILWPEWHANCVICDDASDVIDGPGMQHDARTAEREARKFLPADGWELVDGKWTCWKCLGKEDPGAG